MKFINTFAVPLFFLSLVLSLGFLLFGPQALPTLIVIGSVSLALMLFLMAYKTGRKK